MNENLFWYLLGLDLGLGLGFLFVHQLIVNQRKQERRVKNEQRTNK